VSFWYKVLYKCNKYIIYIASAAAAADEAAAAAADATASAVAIMAIVDGAVTLVTIHNA
jgi:hypothetical protein